MSAARTAPFPFRMLTFAADTSSWLIKVNRNELLQYPAWSYRGWRIRHIVMQNQLPHLSLRLKFSTSSVATFICHVSIHISLRESLASIDERTRLAVHIPRRVSLYQAKKNHPQTPFRSGGESFAFFTHSQKKQLGFTKSPALSPKENNWLPNKAHSAHKANQTSLNEPTESAPDNILLAFFTFTIIFHIHNSLLWAALPSSICVDAFFNMFVWWLMPI